MVLAHTLPILLFIPDAAAECLAQGSCASGIAFHYALLLIV